MSETALDADRLVAGCARHDRDSTTSAPTLWRDGLERLVDSLRANGPCTCTSSASRSRRARSATTCRHASVFVEWRRANTPRSATSTWIPPIVIVGQARTGTTILHDLLAQDHSNRVPLTWETSQRPLPPPGDRHLLHRSTDRGLAGAARRRADRRYPASRRCTQWARCSPRNACG